MNYTNELQLAEFDAQGLSTVAGWTTIYRADPKTREYIGVDMDEVPYRMSVVNDAYRDAPALPKSPDTAICRSLDGTQWEYLPDYRGKTAYHTKTCQPVQITEIGDIPTELTRLTPKTPFDKWNGTQWVTDTVAQHQHEIQQAEDQRQTLQHETELKIARLERKKRLEMATDREIALLREWEIYSVKLTEIDTS
ncbi:tail fiber assembly protein, partial [Xenorhabdus bovienii]|uniref:tail fiber assembly protein n=1 Tax=Xenorhabdus bovienii TaxID=40576 RepID=UPI0021572D87